MNAARRADKRVSTARRLRRDMTDAERRLWQGLRQWPEGRAHFRRHATIGPYFVDFACHTNRLVIELDGGQHGHGPEASRDAARDAFLRANGYRILRFWNHDVLTNTEGVLTVIATAMDASADTPHP
jgi:very-short-patch-repair endonuclease